MKAFNKTEKQTLAVDLMTRYVEVMLEGGSRSGKTFISVYALCVRALKEAGSRHLIVRKHIAHIKASIWEQTLPSVIKTCFPGLTYETNKQDLCITFPNGSQIWCAGSDDKERIEKILGTEWDSIHLNEVSQIPYSTYELFKTRLNPKQGIKPLFLLDQNPPSMSHWTFIKFHRGMNPETKQPLNEKDAARMAVIKMNPADNKANLSTSYIDTLESMSETRKRRFLYGEYGDDAENALWKREWIIGQRIHTLPARLESVVVAVDPAVTAGTKSDDTGIVTCARYKDGADYHYIVINDATYHGEVGGWGRVVCQQYEQYAADKVIGEVNQGGDLVEANIRNYNPAVAYESVRATRGKALRAEPIADLYRRGLVHHYGEFIELEDELCTWTPESDVSPNRLDAVVWGLAYLSGLYNPYATVLTYTAYDSALAAPQQNDYATIARF